MKRLNGKFFILAFRKAAERLLANKDEINALNVFPVPDGDTGSNMSAAILEAVEYLDKANSDDLPEVVNAVKMGMLMGARGNSGVILSQIFRGFSEGVNGRKMLSTKAFTECLEESRKVAYKSVMKPVEGTMLTVIKELAIQASEELEGIDEFTEYFKGLSRIARNTVERTPQLLAKLREAGVVDAGAKGLAYIIEGFELAAKGETDVELLELSTETGTTSAEKLVDIVKEELKYDYCTELIIGFGNNEKSKEEITKELKEYFNDIGDSIVMVNQDSILKIHIHTNHPGDVIEKLLNYGSLQKVKIDNMKVQHEHVVDLVESPKKEVPNTAKGKNHGLISVSPGEGLSEIMISLGTDSIIKGGQTMNPSMKNLLSAMERIQSSSVIILPNNPNIILTAREAARNVMEKNPSKDITVIPTETVQEGIAALTVYYDELGLDELVEEMKEVIETVYPISITHSIRDSSIKGRKVKKGEYIAMGRNELIASGRRLEKVIIESLKTAVEDDDKEIVTVFYGSDIKKEQAEKLIDSLSDKFEDLEFELHKGNQPYYYYLISVE
ncbi:MAG: DAK2 domain-containing protein [Thermotogota bacterium]|nr:DAK2 domain-containing protein [Thermotogota bacterium]